LNRSLIKALLNILEENYAELEEDRENKILYIFIEIQYKHRKSPGKDL
jgi:hypothetical protein